MRNACKCYNTDIYHIIHNVKWKAFEVFMNIKYKIWRHEYLLKSLWNRIVKKYKCKNWFKKANFTNPDVSISPSNPKRYIPGTKVTSKRRAIVFEGFFGGPKNWTGDIGHSAITTPPTWQGRAYQTKSCIKGFWKCHNTKFNFKLDIDLLFECSILTKKKGL